MNQVFYSLPPNLWLFTTTSGLDFTDQIIKIESKTDEELEIEKKHIIEILPQPKNTFLSTPNLTEISLFLSLDNLLQLSKLSKLSSLSLKAPILFDNKKISRGKSDAWSEPNRQK